MKRYAVLLALALFLLMPTTVAAAECQFILGFKTLRDLIGHEVVGECLENEHHGANGDSLQQATGGLLVWRKADNWTAFTDGYRTWINGPNGLVQRLNTERFEWEADYAPGGGIATPTPTAAPVATASPTPTPEPTPIPVPTPNPESIRKIEQAIAALPWVQDGLGNLSERLAHTELWELAAASPQVFWAWMESFAIDTHNGPNINKLVQVSAVAQSDEWAALQMLQTPFMKSREALYDQRILKFMVDLETLSPGSLRQAFAHPKLRNGITDDHIVTFTLLALGIKDPEAAAAIEALPWVRDGVDRPEDDTHYNAYHPTEHEYEAVVNLIEIGLKSPQTLMTLVSKPWVQDSNAEREKAAFWRIEQLAEWDSDSTVQIVAMPFLETFEIGDYDILRNLSEVRYANGGFLRHVVSHPAFVGGITDDHVATVNLIALEVLNPTVGDEFSAFSWIQDGVTHLEQNALNALLELAVTVPELLDSLALKSWMRDGITFDEMFLLYRFGGFPQDDAIRIVSMPFLDSPDDTDFAAVASLVTLQGFLGTKYLKEVLNHQTLRDGITDDTAGLVAVLHNVSKHRPDLISVLLDPEQSIRERRTISLPRGGETKLEVVRTHPGSPHTMDLLEEVVRFHEESHARGVPQAVPYRARF